MVQGSRVWTNDEAPDPWVALAAAILRRALDDARGLRLPSCNAEGKAAIMADARYWLRTGAGGLTAELGIDDQALYSVLESW